MTELYVLYDKYDNWNILINMSVLENILIMMVIKLQFTL